MKGVFIFLLTTLISSLVTAQELGRRVDYRNPKAGDYLLFEDFITFGCPPDIKPQAQVLDDILDSLKLLGGWKLRLEVHTDCRASTEYNDTLSQVRADSIRAYFISKGFPAWRLEAKGMGERMLYVSKCSCDRTDPGNQVCQEKEHQLNRRTLIRLVEKMEWTGQEEVSVLFPSPGQFRLFPVTRYKGTTDEAEIGRSLRQFLDSFPDAYFTVHCYPGKVLSRKKRNRFYTKAETIRCFNRVPSHIRVVNHPWSNSSRGIEGYVVVLDSVLNQCNLLSVFDLECKSGTFISDLHYFFEEDVPWEAISFGGLTIPEAMLSYKTDYTLWIVVTDYPATLHFQYDNKQWKAIQTLDTAAMIGLDYLARFSTEVPQAALIKEIKHKHVPGVKLPCMYILVPRDE